MPILVTIYNPEFDRIADESAGTMEKKKRSHLGESENPHEAYHIFSLLQPQPD